MVIGQWTRLNRIFSVFQVALSADSTATMGTDPFTLSVSLLLDFLATLGGVFVAFRITVWYDRRKKSSEETEIQRRIISALSIEIQKNFDDVKANSSQMGPSAFIVAIFRTSAHQSAVNSGNLLLLKEDLRNSLSNIYLNFQFVETIAAKAFSMLGTTSVVQNWTQYNTRINQMLTDRLNILVRDIPGTLELLKQESEEMSKVKKLSVTPAKYLAGFLKTLRDVKWKYLVYAVAYVVLVWLSQLLVASPDWLPILTFLALVGLGVGIGIALKRKTWVRYYTTFLTWLGITLGSITAGQLSRTTIFLAQFAQYGWAVLVVLGMFIAIIAIIFYLLDAFRRGALVVDASSQKQ